jgi:porin
MKTTFYTVFIFMLVITGNVKSAVFSDSLERKTPVNSEQGNPALRMNYFFTEASYTGDICTNIFGGITTGTKYLGMANLKLGFDTEIAGLWKGGQFFINGAATHGKSPSEFLVGDFQTVSNIDAGDHIYIHELWYKHQFKRFEITFGLQDLNVEFAATDNGSLFINSSFGIPPVISDNIPAPIFPLTALGITSKIEITDNILLSAAVYDGCPTAFEHNLYNTNWHLSNNDGTLVLSELAWSKEFFQLPGTYKAGYYFHSGLTETDPETGVYAEVFDNNYGFYFIADQTVWQKSGSDQSIGVFAQLALSPASINTHHYYLGGGLNYCGISKKQPNDALGLAFACAGFDHKIRKNETTIEMYYKKQICENLFFQPDVQYVINPAGTEAELPNALVGLLRFNIAF